MIADLRAEISSHLEVADIAVEWHYDGLPDIAVAPLVVHTVRALIREGANNVVRHCGASKAVICIAQRAQGLFISLSDNGHGFLQGKTAEGNGFKNLANRVAQLDGAFEVISAATGTTLSAHIPLGWAMERAAE